LPPKDANGFSDPFVKICLLPGREYKILFLDIIREIFGKFIFVFVVKN